MIYVPGGEGKDRECGRADYTVEIKSLSCSGGGRMLEKVKTLENAVLLQHAPIA